MLYSIHKINQNTHQIAREPPPYVFLVRFLYNLLVGNLYGLQNHCFKYASLSPLRIYHFCFDCSAPYRYFLIKQIEDL